MKALISAYACEPGLGSEPGVGWNVVRELSREHELWVITRASNRASIEAGTAAGVGKVHWVYVDPPRWLTFWKKGSRGLRVFYFLWQRCALRAARRLVAEQRFDVVHHLTFGNFLPPSPMARLGVPFVCGPVGGGERMPPGLFESCSTRTKWREWSRDAARDLACRWPAVRRAYRESSACLAATPGTAATLRSLGARQVRVQHQSALDVEESSRLESLGRAASPPAGPLRLIAASRLIDWKGIDLAIDAVALARRAGTDVRLTVAQDGPERRRLEAQARRLGLAGHVDFIGFLPEREDLFREIAAVDALIHPAWHEAFGQVCLESLALGVPVICLDWAGPGMIVGENCGYKVRTGNRAEIVAGLAAAMTRALARRPQREEIALAARARADQFRWPEVATAIDASYAAAVEDHRGS